LDEHFTRVDGKISAEVEGPKGDRVYFSIVKDDQIIFEKSVVVGQDGNAETVFSLQTPNLWFPYRYGKQELYKIYARLSSSQGTDLFGASKRIGFRKAELVQEVDEMGKSFYFRINGIDIFCGGSNWIPADSFTPRISKDRYRSWLQMLIDGNQSMIRLG
jgi:beta-mannosidase